MLDETSGAAAYTRAEVALTAYSYLWSFEYEPSSGNLAGSVGHGDGRQERLHPSIRTCLPRAVPTDVAVRPEQIEAFVTGVSQLGAIARRVPARLVSCQVVESMTDVRRRLHAAHIPEQPVMYPLPPGRAHHDHETAERQLARLLEPVLCVQSPEQRDLVRSVLHPFRPIKRHGLNVGAGHVIVDAAHRRRLGEHAAAVKRDVLMAVDHVRGRRPRALGTGVADDDEIGFVL